MSRKILLIDDSDEIGQLIAVGLEPYSVRHVRTLAEAEVALQESFDLYLIDVRLPDGNGLEFCEKLSREARHANIPRILLTANDEASDKVYAFNCGADDYIVKPFNLPELRARIDRSLKRQTKRTDFTAGNFFFNLEFQTCGVIDGQQKTDLGLTPTEFRMFLHLASNEGRVLSRRDLKNIIWETMGATIETRGIDTHVAHLRAKLGTHRGCVVSVYGQGYAFKMATPDKIAA